MSPIERKLASESVLRSRGLPLNEHLPLVEAEEEVTLRSEEEVVRRLVALWAVVGSAYLPGNTHFREYIVRNGFESWLSRNELRFLLDSRPGKHDSIQFSWKLECLYFLAWCAGLIEGIEIPDKQSKVEPITGLFPQDFEEPDVLRRRLRMQSKASVMDWADLLYRLHWSVRDARLAGVDPPPGISAGAVQEWHLAVNWMTRYEQEDDWDHVGTDT